MSDAKIEFVPNMDARIVEEIEFYPDGKVRRVVYRPYKDWPTEITSAAQEPKIVIDTHFSHNWENGVCKFCGVHRHD